MQICKNATMQVCMFASLQVCRYVCMKVYDYACMQFCKCKVRLGYIQLQSVMAMLCKMMDICGQVKQSFENWSQVRVNLRQVITRYAKFMQNNSKHG